MQEMLSLPPLRFASVMRVSPAVWREIPELSISSMRWSVTILVSPSEHKRKRSLGIILSSRISTSTSGSMPRALVITFLKPVLIGMGGIPRF